MVNKSKKKNIKNPKNKNQNQFFSRKIFFYKEDNKSKKKILFVDRERIDNLFILSTFCTAVSKKFKQNTIILTDKSKDSLNVRFYKKLGFKNFLNGYSFNKLFTNLDITLKTFILSLYAITKIYFNGFGWLINEFKINKIYIGDLIYDTNIRYNDRYLFLKIDKYFIKILFSAIFRFLLIKQYILKYNINKIVIPSETGSRNLGLTHRIGASLNIKNYTLFRAAGSNISVMTYDKKILNNAVGYLTKSNLKKITNQISLREINRFYNKRKKFQTKNLLTYNDHVRANKNLNLKSDFLASLKKNENKKILFAAHAFFDAPHIFGKFVFNDYYHQLLETLKFVYQNDNKNIWIFKRHPSSKLPKEKNIFKSCLQKYKKKNIFLCPDDVPTNSLIKVCDAIVTGRGTIGMESACEGKLVITGGKSPYSNLNISREPKNTKDYFRYLSQISNNFDYNKKIILAKKALYVFENGLNVNSVSISTIKKNKFFFTYMKSLNQKNKNNEKIFYLVNKLTKNDFTKSGIFKNLMKII